jgi:choline dehydrogenase-like flavoprotein
MIAVIGSGPAGVSAAVALARAGRSVTLVDAGLELEPERQQIVAGMQSQEHQRWDPGDVRRIKEGITATGKGVLLKRIYGSDFSYRSVDRHLPMEQSAGVATSQSLALGGLSNVWGASLLPYRAADIRAWPIAVEDLAEHYTAVLSFMEMSAQHDDLEAILPLYRERGDALDSSPQADSMLGDMAAHRESLQSLGIHFGKSRVAVRAAAADGKPGCAYCGLCMYGCPYRLIYNSASTLDKLRQNGLCYRQNVIVERLEETKTGVVIKGKDRLTGQSLEIQAERVMLGCGPLATTRILLESMQRYDHPLELRDSHYFLFPLLRYQKNGEPRSDRMHTLAQMFLEIIDPALSAYGVHLQAYTYNDLYLGAMRNKFGPAYYPLKPLIHALVDRMVVLQCFLHSDVSPSIEVTLRRPAGSKPGKMILAEMAPAAATRQIRRRVVKKLGRAGRYLRAMPLGMLLQAAPAGRGFHSGGTFPMRLRPGDCETDILGRPTGFERVHVVDSSTFPSIPATTITFTVMANAHRIASNVANA